MGKALYRAISVLAIVNLLGLGALVGYLFGTGRLNAERIDRIAAVLRGEIPGDASPTTRPAPVVQEKATAETQLARAGEETDLAYRVLERRRREIEDRQRLAETLMMDVVQRQEALAGQRESFDAQQRKIREQRLHEGFVKELELLASVKPKVRKDMLRGKSDADVVRLMMELDERAGKQVVEACRTPEDKAWIGRVLHLIQTQQAIPPSADAEVEEQDAP